MREKLKGIADRKALTDRNSGHLLSSTTLTGRGALGRVGFMFAGQQRFDNLLKSIVYYMIKYVLPQNNLMLNSFT